MADALVMLDRALQGAAFSVPHRISALGAEVRVRVLSPRELASVGVARAQAYGGGAKATIEDHRIRCAVLALACSLPSDGVEVPAFASTEDVASYPADVVSELWTVYLAAHERTYVTDDTLESAMDARESEPGYGLDELRARYATGLVAYFGLRSALDATPAQVVWFAKLLRGTDR